MTTDATRATAEAMPTINRRRMLLGLAAASTAAATVTVATPAAPAENPKLFELAEELPAIAAAFHAVNNKYNAEYQAWDNKTPDAPEELTASGTRHPNEGPREAGEPEMWALGGFLWRRGAEKYPRRIVIKAWHVDMELSDARRKLRKAKKAGCVVDCLHLNGEIKRLKRLHSTASTYEREFRSIQHQAQAWHKAAYPVKAEYRDALEQHVAAIMDVPDFTMEGTVIKAQALAEWDRVGSGWGDKLAIKYGQNWQGQIAASILRHAQGGAA